jgi:hypothetical protein
MTSPEHQSLVERFNAVLDGSESRIADRIRRALARAYAELEDELRRKYPNYQSNGSLVAYQRKLLLLNELKDLLNVAGGDFSRDFEELLRIADATGIELGDRLLQLSGEDFVRSTATIPIEALKYAAEEQTRYLAKYGDEFAGRASGIIEQGLIQGWGVAKVAGELRKSLEVTKTRAEIIARTASLSASNAATEKAFRDNGVEWVQWMATADSRVCFPAGTRVRVPGGERAIEEIKGGDEVLTLGGYKTVYSVSKREYEGILVRLKAGGRWVECTADHQLFTQRGWSIAWEILRTDFLRGAGEPGWSEVQRSERDETEPITVYNLSVSGLPQYFANGFLAHNCSFCAARNGNMYEIGATRPPIHYQDRCFIVPVKRKYFDLGLVREDWIRSFRAAGLEELKKADREPNYGVAPFERSAGLERAPVPVWRP